MQTTIETDGEDLVATIPEEILRRAGLQVGDEVDVTVKSGIIVIKKLNGHADELATPLPGEISGPGQM